jgi:mono/diheme cytochrome c family protein
MKRALAWIAIAAAAAAGAAVGVVAFGAYDISALDEHLRPTYWLLDVTKRRAVAQRARAISVPPLDEARVRERGVALYDRHCTACHGAPGVAPQPFALSMKPAPASLVHTARQWTLPEIYWTVRYGIKMTGMPAWQFRLPDDDLWAISAFVERMPQLTPRQYQAAVAQAGEAATPIERADATEPDPRRGRTAIDQYACATCHRIPGIVGDNAPVGPPLDGIGRRELIAGRLPNSAENLERWLREPKAINPESAMPALGVSERDARDIAAYLRTLR